METTVGTSRRGVSAWTVDALLGASLALTMAAVISVNHGGRNDPDALAYLWAIGLGTLMLVRRRYPIVVLAITVLGLFAYYAAGYPAVGVAVPIAAALYSAAELGRTLRAVVAGAVTLATSVFFRLLEGQELSLVVGYELAGHAFLIVGAIALGDAVRARRALIARAEEIVALTSNRTQRETEAKAQARRVSVARDLHDSIGHSTSVVSLHTDVAREAVERGDEIAATRALQLIKETTGSIMGELRRTVAVLRAPDGPSGRPEGLSDLQSLLDLGRDVDVIIDVCVPDVLPRSVDAAAFRIIQESLTNIVKHSTATQARIEAGCCDGQLEISVIDNGRPTEPSAPVVSRHGVDGMRERAIALGGTLEAGPVPEGFAVHAQLPLESPA